MAYTFKMYQDKNALLKQIFAFKFVFIVIIFQVTGIGYSGHGEVLLDGQAASEFTDTSLTQLIKVFFSTFDKISIFY